MQSTIADQDVQGVAVEVRDNAGCDHRITVDYEGEVLDHATDGYALDPERRTLRESERLLQAVRFARYTVYSQQGHEEVLPYYMNPDRLALAQDAIRRLPDEQFDDCFGGLARQMASQFTDDLDRPIDLPATLSEDALVVYRMNLYLEVDPATGMEGFADLFEAMSDVAGGDQVDAFQQFADAATQQSEGVREFMGEVYQSAAQQGTNLAEMFTIGGYSGVEVVIDDGPGPNDVIEAGDPNDRTPDAQVTLPPVDPGTREQFRDLLTFHMLCQTRDSFIGMGVEPPREDFRYPGPGMHEYTVRYRTLDIYDRYHDPDADHDWQPR